MRTNPGFIIATAMPSTFQSSASDNAPIFNAAFDIRYEYLPPDVFSEICPKAEESTANFDPWRSRDFIPRAIRNGPMVINK